MNFKINVTQYSDGYNFLSDQYFKEWKVVTSMGYCHPEGLDFYGWLLKKNYIDEIEHTKLIKE